MNGNNIPWMRLFWTATALAAIPWRAPSFVTNLRPEEKVLDFFQEWASARNYFEGIPIYTHQNISIRRHLHGEPHSVGKFIEYNAHPPSSVLLALPFAPLSYTNAFLLWSLFSLLCLGLSGWLIHRCHPNALTPWSILPCVALLLWCNPFRQQMNQGQLNLVLLLLLTASWAADRSDRPWLAGGLLGAATAFKLFPGYLFIYFAARRQWRPLVGGTCGFLGLTALTVLILGPACYRDYTTIVVPSLAEWRTMWPNISLAGFWHKLFNSQGSHVIPLWQNPALAWTATLLSDAILTLVVVWFARQSRTTRERDLAFALTTIAMVLASPIAWDHYVNLLFLALLVIWGWIPRTTSRVAFWLLIIALWMPLLFYWRLAFPKLTPETWHDVVATPRQALTVLSMQTYILLGLFVFTMLVLVRGSANQTPAPATCKRAVHE